MKRLYILNQLEPKSIQNECHRIICFHMDKFHDIPGHYCVLKIVIGHI